MIDNSHTQRHVLAIGAMLVVCSSAVPTQPVAAQVEPVVLHACFVPDVGAVYRIKTEGAPAECFDPTHVEFAWNMQGPPGPPGEGLDLSCTEGQIAKWSGSGWACGTDADTQYAASTGLALAGTVFSIEAGGVGTEQLANASVTPNKLAEEYAQAAHTHAGTIEEIRIEEGAAAVMPNTTNLDFVSTITSCPIGFHVVGGGAHIVASNGAIPPRIAVIRIGPSGTTGWTAMVREMVDQPRLDVYLTVKAICVKLS